MSETWFKSASNSLHETLNENDIDQVNGFEFLVDFLTENPSTGIESSTSDYRTEEIEDIVRNGIDEFETWLRESASDWLSIGGRYKWSLQDGEEISMSSVDLEPEEFSLTPNEELLLTKDFALLTQEDMQIASDLYQKALNTDDRALIARCALRVAWSMEEHTVSYSDRAEKWEIAGDKTKESKSHVSYPWYIKSAEIHARNMNHFESARIYEKSIKQGIEENLKVEELLQTVRACKQQFELAGDGEGASRVFVKENDIKLGVSKGKEWFFLSVYKFLCNYGEAPRRVLLSALIVILVCSIFYTLGGIYSSKDEIPVNNFLTGIYFSVVTFTTLGYGDFSPLNPFIQIISALEAVSGLFLTSLFLATVIRKYSR